MNFDLLRVMTIKNTLWRTVMPWGLTLLGTILPQRSGHFLPCLELNFNHTTAQKAVFIKLLTNSMAQGFSWKVEGPLVSQVFPCFYACTFVKFTKVMSGSNLELKATILQHHTHVLSFNMGLLFTNRSLLFRFPGLNVYEFWISPICAMSSAHPFK